MKKQMVGKIGNTVYMLEVQDDVIYPSGIEIGFKLMDSSFWLSPYSMKSWKEDRKALNDLIDNLMLAYDKLCEFDIETSMKENERISKREMDKEFPEVEVKKPKKTKKTTKESGV